MTGHKKSTYSILILFYASFRNIFFYCKNDLRKKTSVTDLFIYLLFGIVIWPAYITFAQHYIYP